MTHLIQFLFSLIVSSARTRLSLQFEVAALRHQLSVYRVERRKPRISSSDRMLWSLVSKWWSGWRKALYFVQPRTVVAWQNRRFRDYWRALSQHGQPGRPKIALELRQLIKRMWQANPYVGLTPDRLGTQNAGHRCRKIHRRAVQTQAPQTALPELENLSRAACSRARLDRFFRRAYGHFEGPISIGRLGSRSAPDRPFQRHGVNRHRKLTHYRRRILTHPEMVFWGIIYFTPSPPSSH